MKRSRTDIVVQSTTGDKTTGLQPRQHPDLPKGAIVHLRPAVLLSGDKSRVTRVGISPKPRTPSPFGNRMGDHTIAWQVHLDAIKAMFFGQTPNAAHDLLKSLHTEATHWMPDVNSDQAVRLSWLDDADARAELLEDASYHTLHHLTDAERELLNGHADQGAAALSAAIAHHLAYVNYLPFSTVRNLSSRGSIGSAEGHQRRIVMTYERHVLAQETKKPDEGMVVEAKPKPTLPRSDTVVITPEQQPPVELPPQPPTAGEVKQALWRLFSFDAALRETGLDYLLVPTKVAAMRAEYDELSKMSESLTKHISKRLSFILDVDAISTKADMIYNAYKESTENEHIFAAASAMRNAIRALSFRALETPAQRRTATSSEQRSIGVHLGLALTAVTDAEDLVKQGDKRVVSVMAALLHEHQRLCCIAYPRSVVHSGFVQPSPADAGVEALRAYLATRHPALMAGDTVKNLLTNLKTELDRAPALPGTGHSNAWVGVDTGDPLVVTFQPPQAMVINGRAPAPGGVAGMGCHTTAWIIQSTAVKRLLVHAADEPSALDILQQAVTADLASEVMKLDALLPLAQIEAGQLDALFDAAAATMAATSAGEGATAYLTFRNLLPYATVDAGDRGGHGETLQATLRETFDDDALDQTIGLHVADLASRKDVYVKRLRTAAAALRKQIKDGNEDWTAYGVVRQAVLDSAKRLAATAVKIDKGTAGDVGAAIRKARKDEHAVLFARAHS
ncbi:hypothetical protein ACIBG8_05825 [Nonomuraea sp. NPDC050556]|uniref:hypothetical protein n=1 Tax=Nonomuraea sp. NPDC050556 TaxID=3364369 RepID=UPI0037BB633B